MKYIYEVFCRLRPGVSLLALYGTLHQMRRMSIYESFCKKQYAVLFATDIAARGLGTLKHYCFKFQYEFFATSKPTLNENFL